MSATVLKEFLVKLGFAVDKNGAETFSSKVFSAGKNIAVLGAAAQAAAGAVVGFVSVIADSIDNLADVSGRTGEAASELDKLGYIATLTDSSIEASNASVENLSKNIGDAAMGMGRAQKVFEELGVSVKKENGQIKTAAEMMAELKDKMQGMGKGQQLAIMDRLGIDRTMIGMMTQDVSGLAAEYDAMQKAAGFSMEEAASSASDYMDAMNKLKLLFAKLMQSVAVPFFKGMTKGMETMQKMLVDNMPRIVAVITPVIKIILALQDVFLAAAQGIVSAISFVISPLMELNRMLGGVPAYILGAAVAWKVLSAAFAASPIGVVVAGIMALIAAIVLLKEDFDVWKAGGESLIDWELWVPAIEAAQGVLEGFRGFLTDWFSALGAMFQALFALLSGDFVGAWEGVKSMLGSVIDMFSGVINIASKVGGVIGSVAGGIAAIVGGKSALTPSPAAGASGQTNQNVNQQTVINVNGAGDPKAVGNAVAGQQSGVNNQMQRNLQGAVR